MQTWLRNQRWPIPMTPVGGLPSIDAILIGRLMRKINSRQRGLVTTTIMLMTVVMIQPAAIAQERSATLPAQSSSKPDSGNWIQPTENGVKLFFKGQVLNRDGSLADVARVRVIDHPNPLANNPRVRNVPLRNGLFSFGSIGLGYVVVWASNMDGSEQALQLIPKHHVAAAARSGDIKLQLEPARLLAVGVKDNTRPVIGAQVLVRVSYGLEILGQTARNGIAPIHLPKGQLPNDIRAWTADHRLGFVDFRNTSDRDRKKTFHNVDLSDCKPLKVRVLNEAGTPQTSLSIRLGVSNSSHQWVNDTELFEAITDKKGEATFAYFPNWEDERHYLYTDASQRFIEREPQIIDGVDVYTLGTHEPTINATFQLRLPDLCPGGMTIEGWSFQSREDHRSTVFFSRVDDQGRFAAPVVPGYTYHLFLNDGVWVSKPVAGILADPETRTATPLNFEIVRGADVVVKVTAGPSHTPLAGQWVHLETPHDFEWKENGKSRSGSGGRRWGMITDANGEVHTRAYPGPFQARASAGSSNLEKSITIEADITNEFELHRETTGPTHVTGRLTSNDPTAVLEGAKVTIDQAESSFIEPPVDAVADASGEFEARVDCSLAFAYARTADGKYSGATRFRTNDQEFPIELLKVGRVGGQVLDSHGIPIEGGDVFASATLKPFEKPDDAGDNWPWSLSVTQFRTTTDKDGKFLFEQLPAQMRVLIGLNTDHVTPNTFRSLAEVYLDPGESREGNVYRERVKKTVGIDDQFAQLLRNCRCVHTHGLVLVGGNSEAVERYRREAVDYDAHPDVVWYLPLLIDLADDAGRHEQKQEFLEQRDWAAPNDDELLLVAVDMAGNTLGQLVVSSAPNNTENDSTQSIAAFLSEHRIHQQDAREKLGHAIAEAKRSGRRVWARVGGTRCGPCIRMANWLDDQRTLIEEAFVLVEIDATRDLHGAEVAAQLKHEGGIPWHVMLNAEGQILVTSESPIGNIGSPDTTPESLGHMRFMFTEAASDLLTTAQITVLLETID